MKDLLTLATATLLCTATAAYAGEAVGEDFAIADTKLAAKPASFKPSTRLAALDARMAEHKLAEFKETGVKPAADALAMDDAPKPETPKDGEPLPALMASTQTLDAEGYYYDAIAKNDKALTDKQVDVAVYQDGFIPASWDSEPAMDEMAALDPAAKPAAFEEKKASTATTSPFGVTSNSEIAALEASGAEPMGGPLDPAEFLAEGWSTHDADADGGLTPLEFGGWVASDAGKPGLAAEAEAERGSADEGTATVQLLNGTSLEFGAADANDDLRVTADELTAFVATA